MMEAFLLLVLGIAIGWHLSSLYHQRRWSRDIWHRAETLATGVYRLPAPREDIDLDQELTRLLPPQEEPPSIRAICLDAHFGNRWRPRP